MVLEAIKKVGKKDREAILQGVPGDRRTSTGGALGKWSFDENGDTTLQKLTISKVEGGKFKPVKTVDRVTDASRAASDVRRRAACAAARLDPRGSDARLARLGRARWPSSGSSS